MKRIVLLLTVLTTLSFGSFAQMRVALIGGPQWADVKETNSLPGWETTTSPYYSQRMAFHLGFLGEVPLNANGRFVFMPGMYYSAKGRKFARRFDDATATLTDTLTLNNSFFTNYIELPFNLGYKIPLGKKASFLLSAGPYLSFYISGKSTTDFRSFSTNKFTKISEDIQVGKGENKVQTFDYGVNGRAGFDLGKVMITGYYSMGLSDFYTASYDGSFKHNVYGASLGIWLNKTPERKPRDKDKDGIPDAQDACPDEAGPAATNGCPDKDGDGVPDKTDKCPTVAGLAKYQGCPIPDTDKDGINDEEDQCITVPGIAKYKGCPIPDTDKDGINDEEDQCITVPGVAKYHGCPVPDRDKDGVNDEEDKCPDQPGTAENKGCPEIKKEVVEKVNFAARNIFFKNNSDQLQERSGGSLDEVVKVLQEHPELSMRIEGHTDISGTADHNLELSHRRAETVKAFLVSKGIAAERLKAEGFGASKPVADNKTPEGRAKNRRVELILEQ